MIKFILINIRSSFIIADQSRRKKSNFDCCGYPLISNSEKYSDKRSYVIFTLLGVPYVLVYGHVYDMWHRYCNVVGLCVVVVVFLKFISLCFLLLFLLVSLFLFVSLFFVFKIPFKLLVGRPKW